MKCSILQENLARALSAVGRVVDNRPTMPVLANVLLTAKGSRLHLAASNLSLSITTAIGAKVEQEGAITLPARTLTELVAALSPERVDLTLDAATHTVLVKCGASQAHIRGIAATEFPLLPQLDRVYATVKPTILKAAVAECIFASATDEARPILTGIYMAFEGETLELAAADGYRLAVRTLKLDAVNFSDRRVCIVPARSLREAMRSLDDEAELVEIQLPENGGEIFHVSDGRTTVSTQVLSGQFPHYNDIIPKGANSRATVYTNDFALACKRAEIFARDSANSARLSLQASNGAGEPGTVTVAGRSAERGDNEGYIDAAVDGDSVDVHFNIRYFLEALNAIKDERVTFETNGPSAPGVLIAGDRSDWMAVMMPMSHAK